MSKFPISPVCPGCGNAAHQTIRSEDFVAFANDRICTACNTRYTPPTPTWAAIVFILVGIVLGGFGGLSLVVRLMSANPAGLPAMACEGFLGFLGILAFAQGIRALMKPGQA